MPPRVRPLSLSTRRPPRWLRVALYAVAGGAAIGPGAAAQTAAPRAPVEVTAPVVLDPVQRTPDGRGQLTAAVVVGGRAEPLQHLRLDGACGARECAGVTFAGADGTWRTRLRLTAPKRRSRGVTLTAGYADPRTGEEPARIRVALDPPPAPAAWPSPPRLRRGDWAAAPAAEPGARPVLVVGDSLAVGGRPELDLLLPGWPVRTDARVGRTLAEGMQVLADLQPGAPDGDRRPIVAFSLFTNDPPQELPRLEAAVRSSVAALPARGCAVWATIARPAAGTAGYRRVNARLRALGRDPALAPRLRIVRWAEAVRRRPRRLGRDRVHPTAEGRRARALMYAEAIRSCDGGPDAARRMGGR